MLIDSSVHEFCNRFNLPEKDRIYIQHIMNGYMDKEVAGFMGVSEWGIRTRWRRLQKNTNKRTKQDIMSDIYMIEKDRSHSETMIDEATGKPYEQITWVVDDNERKHTEKYTW